MGYLEIIHQSLSNLEASSSKKGISPENCPLVFEIMGTFLVI
jgi:hypothetical protein